MATRKPSKFEVKQVNWADPIECEEGLIDLFGYPPLMAKLATRMSCRTGKAKKDMMRKMNACLEAHDKARTAAEPPDGHKSAESERPQTPINMIDVGL